MLNQYDSQNSFEPLTTKQSAFVDWYCSEAVRMNGTEAARRAGYSGSDATLRSIASENLTKPNIQVSIEARIRESASDTKITIDKVLLDLETTRIQALCQNKFGIAVRCSELQGKYLGMFSVNIKMSETIDEMDEESLIELLVDFLSQDDPEMRRVLSIIKTKLCEGDPL